MSWPVRLRHNKKGKAWARIYRRPGQGQGYRLYWRVRDADGKPRSRTWDFTRYSDAKKAGDGIVSDLVKGSQKTALTPGQVNDAIAAFKALQGHFERTGHRLTLHEAAVEAITAPGKLPAGKTVGDAIDGYLTTVATVQRKPLAEAVADFLKGRKHLGESKDGKRSTHSPVYEYNVGMWLNEFADTFPGHTVCDLTKEHLNTYIKAHNELSAKSRNDRRAVVKMFLRWAVAKDYLLQTHRLFEAVDFKTEATEIQEIEFYRPKELRLMLDLARRLHAWWMPLIPPETSAGVKLSPAGLILAGTRTSPAGVPSSPGYFFTKIRLQGVSQDIITRLY